MGCVINCHHNASVQGVGLRGGGGTDRRGG